MECIPRILGMCSKIHVRLRHDLFRVGIEGGQVAQAGLVGHVNAVVQGNEVVIVVLLNHHVHEAVVDRDVPVDDLLAVALAEVDLELARPHHAVRVLKRVGDAEVHAGVDQDVVFQLDEWHAGVHPVDIHLGDFPRVLHREAFQGGLGAHGFPFFLFRMLATQELLLLVGFVGLHAHVLVVAFEEMHIVFLLLQVHQVVDDAFPVGATVDVVAQKIELVVFRHLEHVLKQGLQGAGAAVNVGDDPAL